MILKSSVVTNNILHKILIYVHRCSRSAPKTALSYTHTVMKRFTDGVCGESLVEEREALVADMKHLREQCERCGYSDESGAGAVMSLERSRLFHILCTQF